MEYVCGHVRIEGTARQLVQGLIARDITISTAESCTGGRMAAALTAIPRSSKVFPGGIVTYCNEVKRQILGVSRELLDTYGAVSEPVARAMAVRAAQILGTDMALSATGYAGPDRDDAAIPGGTVYLGLFARGEVICEHHVFSGNRAAVQWQAAERALEMALEWMEQ